MDEREQSHFLAGNIAACKGKRSDFKTALPFAPKTDDRHAPEQKYTNVTGASPHDRWPVSHLILSRWARSAIAAAKQLLVNQICKVGDFIISREDEMMVACQKSRTVPTPIHRCW